MTWSLIFFLHYTDAIAQNNGIVNSVRAWKVGVPSKSQCSSVLFASSASNHTHFSLMSVNTKPRSTLEKVGAMHIRPVSDLPHGRAIGTTGPRCIFPGRSHLCGVGARTRDHQLKASTGLCFTAPCWSNSKVGMCWKTGWTQEGPRLICIQSRNSHSVSSL